MGNGPASGNGQAPNQPASPVSGNDQASATTQANNTASPSSGPNGQAPTATSHNSSDFAPPSADEWKRVQQEIAEARRDAAKYRDELKKRDDATLTAQQKLERDYADTQTKALEQELTLQRLHLENAGYRLAAKLQVADVSAVLALVQTEHSHEIERASDGTPQNLDKLIAIVLKEHPALVAAQTGQPGQRPPTSSGGATNPGSSARVGAPATWTREQIARMSPEEYQANKKAILEAMAKGLIGQ